MSKPSRKLIFKASGFLEPADSRGGKGGMELVLARVALANEKGAVLPKARCCVFDENIRLGNRSGDNNIKPGGTDDRNFLHAGMEACDLGGEPKVIDKPLRGSNLLPHRVN